MNDVAFHIPSGLGALSTADAQQRLIADGPNRLVAVARRSWWKRWFGPLADPMVALLLVAAPTYLFIGDATDAIVVFVALIPIAGVGWVLEARSERTLEKLRQLIAPTASVIRDGQIVSVLTEEIVVGDVMLLHEGDIIAADVQLVDLTQFLVDESTLTGESLPAVKAVGGTDHEDLAWAGTTVLAGRALARVTATGAHTRYGQIGTLVAGVRSPATPLQRALGRLVRVLAIVAAVVCASVMAAELLRGRGFGQAVIAGVSLAIAAIPEEFSMVYALYLALGAWELARGDALVRRLPGVETLGSTTVICTDKTGTLTQGHLAVAAVLTSAAVTTHDIELSTFLTDAVLACEPDPYDPLDRAIVDYAEQAGISASSVHRAALVADWPFDPVDKYITHVWRLPDGTHRVVAKGSIEGIMRHVSTLSDSSASREVLRLAQQSHDTFADQGMRVIAVSVSDSDGPSGDRERDESGLTYAGLIAFSDPVREGVAEALEQCRTAGIRVIMITGDHPATAHAVAEGLQLPHDGIDGDLIATGDQLDVATDAEFKALAATANVFARTRPEHKHRLVVELRAQGEVVAMTGDGTNDAPALRAADIGVAMGKRGTEVAREAATIVLLDDNFATIVHAVRNGRRIYDNLAHAFGYLIAFHAPLLLTALIVPLLGRPLLLLPVHLILLELLLHPVVSLVFQADAAEDDVMTRPPRPASSGLGFAALWRPYAVGIALAGGILGLYLVALARGWSTEQARGFGFAALLASQALLLVVERAPHAPIWSVGLRPTKQLVGAFGVIALATVASVYLHPVAHLLQTKPFPALGWVVLLVVIIATTIWSEPLKRGSPKGH
jgi:Ca2+-transporting ATPase